jgi:Spy/CpxP family protein refolding chaperone
MRRSVKRLVMAGALALVAAVAAAPAFGPVGPDSSSWSFGSSPVESPDSGLRS